MSDFFIKPLLDGGLRFEESNLKEHINAEFWHSTVIDRKQVPVAGGFSKSRSQARKIAVSEFLERKSYREIAASGDEVRKLWGLDIIPTACGFACGFTLAGAIQRSVAEAVERWVASKWIDEDLYLEEIPQTQVASELDRVSIFLMSPFLETRFFKKKVSVTYFSQTISIAVAITLGLTENGIFVGSSAQKNDGNIWQHALLESFRHFIGINNNPLEQMSSFPGNKVRFFSQNRNLALDQVDRKKIVKWPEPELVFHLHREFDGGQYFIARSIVGGWTSWSEGPMERFLY